MSVLPLSLFDAASDAEATQYRVLAGLNEARSAFRDLRVEPYFADLVGLHRALAALVAGASAVEDARGAIVGIDWEAGRLLRQGPAGAPLAIDLARWALPLVSAAVAEGKTVYEFASESAELAAVGVVPAYRDEGYLLIHDDDGVRVLRYQISPLMAADGAYRALRTTDLDLRLDPLATSEAWKAALVETAPDLPAPAAFRVATELDLPVDETLVPVAKRKLLGLIGDWGEA